MFPLVYLPLYATVVVVNDVVVVATFVVVDGVVVVATFVVVDGVLVVATFVVVDVVAVKRSSSLLVTDTICVDAARYI